MKKTNPFFLFFLCLIFSSLTHCGGVDKHNAQETNPGDFEAAPDGGTGFDPLEGDEVDPAPDECVAQGAVVATPVELNFGLGEINPLLGGNELTATDCLSVSLNTCESFSAEITQGESTEFVISNNGAQVLGRVDNLARKVDVCYRRSTLGSHFGRLSLVTGSSRIVVPLSGETLPAILNITNPRANPPTVLWEGNRGILPGDNNDPFDRYLPHLATGNVNLGLRSIVEGNEVSIWVKNGGRKVSVPFDQRNGLFGSLIKIPFTPQVYPVEFSLNTNKGVLSKSVDVIRLGAPQGEIFVRGSSGSSNLNVIGDERPLTDELDLYVGVVVRNLEYSGPSNSFPVKVTVTHSDGNGQNEEVIGAEQVIYKDKYSADKNDGASPEACEKKFDDPVENKYKTLCVKMKSTQLVRGVNKIRARVCNPYTDLVNHGACSVFETTLVVDNDKPVISFRAPTIEGIGGGKVFGLDDVIKVKAVISNYLQNNPDNPEECGVKVRLNSSVGTGSEVVKPYLICPRIVVAAGDPNEGNRGNVRRGEMTLTLARPGVQVDPDNNEGTHIFAYDSASDTYKEVNSLEGLTLFTNLLSVEAKDAKGHTAIRTRSFQRGELRPATMTQRGGKVMAVNTALLGSIESTDQTSRTHHAPVMANVRETIIDRKVKALVEDLLNDSEDGLKFSELVQGGKLPGDENGNLIHDADEEDPISLHPGYPNLLPFFTQAAQANGAAREPILARIRKMIWENLHGTMPQKVYALTAYQTYARRYLGYNANGFARFSGGDSSTDVTALNGSNPVNWNVARDSCGGLLPTAIVPYNAYQYIFGEALQNPNAICDLYREWPATCGKSNDQNPDVCDLDCNDTVQGKWKVGNINLKANGFIDAQVCLMGKGVWEDVNHTPDNPCDDVQRSGNPAFWGSAAAWGLVVDGITRQLDDPTLPIIWNIGRLNLNLVDALQIRKVRVAGANGENQFTNKIIVNRNAISLNRNNGSIRLEPYQFCPQYYRANYPDFADRSDEYGADLPLGCADGGYPILIDHTALAGHEAINNVGRNGDTFLLGILRDKLLSTFKDILLCTIEEQGNPIISQGAIPYPPWVKDEDRMDLNFTLDQKFNDAGEKDGVEFVQTTDAKHPVFNFNTNVREADLAITDVLLGAKLPFSIGASLGNGISFSPVQGTTSSGHLFRYPSPSDFEDHLAENKKLNVALNLEEVLNSVLYTLWLKGPVSLIDIFDLDALKAVKVDDTTIGVDKVILAKLGDPAKPNDPDEQGICGDAVPGLLEADLRETTLFASIGNLFHTAPKGLERYDSLPATHLEVTLNRAYPPTLAIMPDSFTGNNASPNAVTLQIGLSNLELKVKDLYLTSAQLDWYKIGPSILTLRLDALLKIRVVYNPQQREFKIWVLPYKDQVFYLSVLDGGPTYDDASVIKDMMETILPNTISLLQGAGSDGSFTLKLPPLRNGAHTGDMALSSLDDIESVKGNEQASGKFMTLRNLTSLPDPEKCPVGGPEPNYDPRGSYSVDLSNLAINESGVNTSLADDFWNKNLPLVITHDNLACALDPRECPVQSNLPALPSGYNPYEIDLSWEQISGVDLNIFPQDNQSICESQNANNEIKHDFCEYGIEDVYLPGNNPELAFDAGTGYIYLSTDLAIELYPWLYERVGLGL